MSEAERVEAEATEVHLYPFHAVHVVVDLAEIGGLWAPNMHVCAVS